MARTLEIRRADRMINAKLVNWFYGFTPPERGVVVLVHRRVYILPTQLGWLFVMTLAILLIGSINYALSLGFALTFLLAGMGLAGMVHTARNLARMAVSVGRAEPVFAGEAAQFRLYLDARAAFDRPAILARHLRSRSQMVLDVPAAGFAAPRGVEGRGAQRRHAHQAVHGRSGGRAVARLGAPCAAARCRAAALAPCRLGARGRALWRAVRPAPARRRDRPRPRRAATRRLPAGACAVQ